MLDFLGDPVFWQYLSIPFVAAFVGWFTNWVAIQLLFYPIEPIGKPPFFGWVGILPSRAEKMAKITTNNTLNKVGTVKELFQSLDPEKIAQHITKLINRQLPLYIEEIILRENPTVWEMLPEIAKSRIIEEVRLQLPATVHRMMEDLSMEVEHVLDVHHLVLHQVLKDRAIINRIFLSCGQQEFNFIIYSGAILGFLFGLLQMTAWWFYPTWWQLPVWGIVVGFATNWVALRIIFQPLNPVQIGPYVLQGLFLKRQQEVAVSWSEIIAQEILTVENVIHNLLYGPKSDRSQMIIRKYIRNIVDEVSGIAKPLVQWLVGLEHYIHMKEVASDRVISLTASALGDTEFKREEAALLKTMLSDRVKSLSSESFQDFLRPAFQEDETKLVIIGGILGLITGILQYLVTFG
ncbi:MAG: hypothetical protein JNN12_15340 [Bacteroidetes Order II. Incertae sedis bacterium]|nr:hypothetical protein [Bacteroidetes Order II. bacterium]